MKAATEPGVPVLWIGPARHLVGTLGAHINCPFCPKRHFHVIDRQVADAAALTGDFSLYTAPCCNRRYRLLFTDETVDRMDGYCD